MHGFFSAVSGAAAQEIWLEKVSNNLANVNTVGYKGDHPTFEALLVNSGAGGGSGEVTAPVSLVGIEQGVDLSQGAIVQTGNSLDFAIEGEGFFAVDTPQGIRYTRSGNFTINSDGVLATAGGFPVLGKGGALNVSGENIVALEDGTLISDSGDIGRLKLINVDDKKKLIKEGGNLFSLAEGGMEVPVEGARVIQGTVESSNVNVVAEMTMLINISRAYEAYQKVIHAMDEVSAKAINEVGKVS